MFTISNLITSMRIFLLPPIIIAILNKNMQVAIILLLISYLTDVLDGLVARRLNQETEFGKIIDPLTDKITFVVVLIGLSIIDRFPIWGMLILAIREIVIIGGGLFLVATGRKVLPASILGKITGGIFAVMVVVYIIDLRPFLKISLYAALFFMVISFISYVRQFTALIREKDENQQ